MMYNLPGTTGKIQDSSSLANTGSIVNTGSISNTQFQQTASTFEDLDLSVNKCYIIIFTLVLNLCGLLLGYSTGYQNQLINTFDLKFVWGIDTPKASLN